ncbi:hypothetical protein BGX27_004581, partial [Mortierella sp. AM989]
SEKDGHGHKVIEVPVSKASIGGALNAITDLWRVQMNNGWIRCQSPRKVQAISILLRNYSNNLQYDQIQTVRAEMLPAEKSGIYLGQDSIPVSDMNAVAKYLLEYLNSLDPSGLPPYKLELNM